MPVPYYTQLKHAHAHTHSHKRNTALSNIVNLQNRFKTFPVSVISWTLNVKLIASKIYFIWFLKTDLFKLAYL